MKKASLRKVLFSISGYLLGLLISFTIYGKVEGAVGLVPNVRFTIGGAYISPHHWMYFLAALILLLVLKKKIIKKLSDNFFYFFLGFCLGGFTQGLTYSDWYMVVR